MKILSAYTPKHSLRALKRLHKNIVRQQINRGGSTCLNN